MPTVIKIKELGLTIAKENYSTKISINTLNIEKGLALFDIIKMYNESLVDLENRVNASIAIEAQVRITEDEALSRYMIDLEASVDNNLANVNTELTALATETSSLASTVTTVSASVGDLGATITEQAAVYAGYFNYSALPEIGNIKNVSDVNYQYLGGNLGPLSDGWVVYNNTALGTANQVKGWVATASSLVVNPSTGQVTGWQYGDGSGFNSFFTISASKINLVGETTFISNVVSGINNGTTTINGGQITTNSITANQIATNSITANKIQTYSLTALNATIENAFVKTIHIGPDAVTVPASFYSTWNIPATGGSNFFEVGSVNINLGVGVTSKVFVIADIGQGWPGSGWWYAKIQYKDDGNGQTWADFPLKGGVTKVDTATLSYSATLTGNITFRLLWSGDAGAVTLFQSGMYCIGTKR